MYETGSGHVASLGAVVLLLVRAGLYGQQIQGSYTFVRQASPLHRASGRGRAALHRKQSDKRPDVDAQGARR